MADKPKMNPRVQDDKSMLFDARGGVTIRVAHESPTQVKVEMWRDNPPATVAPDVGNIGHRAWREKLAKAAREVFNLPPGKDEDKAVDTVPDLDEDLGLIATTLGVPEIADLLKPESGPTLVDRLVELVEEVGTLFNSQEAEPHVALEIDGHVECHEIRGTRFRRWLRGRFYEAEKERLEAEAERAYEGMVSRLGGMAVNGYIPVKKPPVVRDQILADAVAQLEAKADYQKREEQVHVRVGQHGNRIYVDLGNDRWDAIEIDAEGWRRVDVPPVRFVRPKGLKELPYPERDGSIDELKNILTLGDSEDDKRAWALIVNFLVGSLRSSAAEFPILILLGGQGTAKSTTSRMLKALIDPNAVEDTGEPRNKEELHIDASCSWLMAYDNLSSIPGWLSDTMCRISTGSAFTKRTQYTNRDREIFRARQPQILNGISDVVSRGDIIDRGLMVTLPVIREYREGSAVWADFYEVRPKVMGALYDAVSAGLASEQRGEEITAKLPRMADFAKFALRVETAVGLKPGEFLEAFGGSNMEGAATVLEAEPISYRVFEFAKNFTAEKPWRGRTKDLLDSLNERETDPNVKRGAEWPKAPNKLSGKLSRLARDLARHGVIWERVSESNRQGKIYRLYYIPPGDGGGDDRLGSIVPSTVPTQ